MRKFISSVLFLALTSVSFNALSDNHKQKVCHKGQTISVAKAAVQAHLNHGDTRGECRNDRPPRPEPPGKLDTVSAVVMMRCEAQLGNGVLVVSSSSSPDLGISSREDCAMVLAELLDDGYGIRSISSGTAEAGDGSMRLYTDYLLLKRIPVEDGPGIDA